LPSPCLSTVLFGLSVTLALGRLSRTALKAEQKRSGFTFIGRDFRGAGKDFSIRRSYRNQAEK
jgi:hypothetical protein